MKKIIKLFGLISLVCFSFFYTDKVITVVSDQDPLKLKISTVSDSYKISPNQAVIKNDTIIPGNNGRVVNVEKSYKNMRKNNVFNSNMLVYDNIYPEYRLSDNLDKYIINGNINKKEVSIVFIIDSDNNLDRIINILNSKNVTSNLFIDYNYLNNNINKIKRYNNHNIYSYQDNYFHDTLIISNNIIKKITNNNPSYCLTKEKNKNNINVCSYSNMNIIIPSYIGNLNNVKNNLENGNIILFDTSFKTINELSYIIDFISGKGYKIVELNELLDESI